MKPYKPRKKKVIMTVRRMKLVRIDWKTQIEVSASIPDDVAIERYYERHKTAIRPPIIAQHPMTKDECSEVPQEELAALLDDSLLPE